MKMFMTMNESKEIGRQSNLSIWLSAVSAYPTRDKDEAN